MSMDNDRFDHEKMLEEDTDGAGKEYDSEFWAPISPMGELGQYCIKLASVFSTSEQVLIFSSRHEALWHLASTRNEWESSRAGEIFKKEIRRTKGETHLVSILFPAAAVSTRWRAESRRRLALRKSTKRSLRRKKSSRSKSNRLKNNSIRAQENEVHFAARSLQLTMPKVDYHDNQLPCLRTRSHKSFVPQRTTNFSPTFYLLNIWAVWILWKFLCRQKSGRSHETSA